MRKGIPMSDDRLGWHQFYAKQFDKNGTEHAEHLACWYLFLHLAFD